MAIINANGHSELDLHAYSTGETSPNVKLPLLFINVKSCARPESNGLNKFPSRSTGMCDSKLGRIYLVYVPARSP